MNKLENSETENDLLNIYVFMCHAYFFPITSKIFIVELSVYRQNWSEMDAQLNATVLNFVQLKFTNMNLAESYHYQT